MDESPAWLIAQLWSGAVVLFAGVSLGAMRRMGRHARAMRREGGPGIVAFELAGSTVRAREVMSAWGPAGMAAAARHLRADFTFIVGYTGLLVVLTTSSAPVIGEHSWGWMGAVGAWLGVTVIAAGLLDVSENIALLAVLRLAGTADDLQPQARVARVFATLKFGMIGVVLGWLALVAYPVVLTAAGRGL